MYADKLFIGSLAGYTMEELSASIMRFGFSCWTPDNYADARYDNISLYDTALTDEQIAGGIGITPEENMDKVLFAMTFDGKDTSPIKGSAKLHGSIDYAISPDGTYGAVFNDSPDNYTP